MSLTSGTKLGPYEIQSPLGAGGMGEVYRARDSRLNRDVAIKVLPTIFARCRANGAISARGASLGVAQPPEYCLDLRWKNSIYAGRKGWYSGTGDGAGGRPNFGAAHRLRGNPD